ncbi:MAG: hypothetical protein K0R24_1797 [Gammaproteobacteria bacterium]|jgi:chromosome segregation ATPase|nr:hypothetical protein [Gammaproteobacteria bacterium]
MARIGITYRDVEKAALQLQGQGNLPTIDRIRHVLGTGSKTTITEYLKRWKVQQADGQGKLPHELSALVTGLWERLQAKAEQRISEMQSSYDEQIKCLQQSLAEMQQGSHVLKQQLHQAEENGRQKAEEKQTVDQLLQELQQTHIQLESRYQTSLQQIGDLKADNARLHQMATQIQANLEHYQQAMQLLRAEQSLETEKREANFQAHIQEMKQVSVIAQQEVAALQEKNKSNEHALLQSKKIIDALQAQTDELTQQCQQTKQEVAKITERCALAEQSSNVQQKEARHYQARANELEKNIFLLTEQHQQSTVALQQAKDKIEALRQEKLFLTQEKFELMGSLKQLQQSRSLQSLTP